MNCKQGSYLEFTIPMFLEEAGYTFTMTGQLLHVDSSTSLKFRSLVECETLQVGGHELISNRMFKVFFLLA